MAKCYKNKIQDVVERGDIIIYYYLSITIIHESARDDLLHRTDGTAFGEPATK